MHDRRDRVEGTRSRPVRSGSRPQALDWSGARSRRSPVPVRGRQARDLAALDPDRADGPRAARPRRRGCQDRRRARHQPGSRLCASAVAIMISPPAARISAADRRHCWCRRPSKESSSRPSQRMPVLVREGAGRAASRAAPPARRAPGHLRPLQSASPPMMWIRFVPARHATGLLSHRRRQESQSRLRRGRGARLQRQRVSAWSGAPDPGRPAIPPPA